MIIEYHTGIDNISYILVRFWRLKYKAQIIAYTLWAMQNVKWHTLPVSNKCNVPTGILEYRSKQYTILWQCTAWVDTRVPVKTIQFSDRAQFELARKTRTTWCEVITSVNKYFMLPKQRPRAWTTITNTTNSTESGCCNICSTNVWRPWNTCQINFKIIRKIRGKQTSNQLMP